MNDFEQLEPTCGGTGFLNCFCAGDFCACWLMGGDTCDGCDDCAGISAEELWEEQAR